MTATFSAPTIHLLIPDSRATPAARVTDAPVGFEADADAVPSGVEVVTVENVVSGAVPVGGGVPSSMTAMLSVSTMNPGEVNQTGTWAYTDAQYTAYGHIPLTVMTHAETIAAVSSGNGYQRPRGLALDDGTTLAVGEDWVNGQVVLFERDEDGVWGSAAIGDPGIADNSAYASGRHSSPDIWRSYDRRLKSWVYWVAALEHRATDPASTQRLTLAFQRGDYAWARVPTALTLDYTSTVYDQLRARFDGASRNLLIGMVTNTGGTYAAKFYRSSDQGAKVTVLPSAELPNVTAIDVEVWNGVFYLVALDTSKNVKIYTMTGLASSWSLLATAVTTSASVAERSVALTVTPDGWLWLDYILDGDGKIVRSNSRDHGRTWTETFVAHDHSASGMTLNSLVYQTGHLLTLGSMRSSGTTTDNSLMAYVSGGWSTMTPTTDAGLHLDDYIPTDVPATRNASNTFTTSGATVESITIDGSGRRIYDLSNNNSTGYVTQSTGFFGQAQGQAVMWTLSPDSSGGNVLTDRIALKIRSNNSADTAIAEAGVRLDLSNKAIQCYDWQGAAYVGTAVTYTGTAPLQVYVAVSYTGSGTQAQMSAYYRLLGSESWTAIVEDATITRGAGSGSDISWGKLAASTANVKTLSTIYYLLGAFNPAQIDTSPTIAGKVATSDFDRTPTGISVRWDGSPLQSGAWDVRAWSQTPVSAASPYGRMPSPLRQWRSPAVTAGSSVRVQVDDFGSQYRGKLSSNLVGLSWANAPGLASVTLQGWDGAAFQDIITADTTWTLSSYERDTATGLTFRAAVANPAARWMAPDSLKGMWITITDAGGDGILAQIARNGEGQWSSVVDMELDIEIDPLTIEDATGGGWASLAQSDNAGEVLIALPDGMAIGVQADEAEQYYSIVVELLPGYTLPAAGLLMYGAVLTIDRPYRAGASIDIRTDARLSSPKRIIRLPYDQILAPSGLFTDRRNNFGVRGMAWSSTARAGVDTTVVTIEQLQAMVGRHRGQRRGVPVAVTIDADVQADPASAVQVFRGYEVAHGYVGDGQSTTAGVGFLRPAQFASTQHGTELVIDEVALWLDVQ